MMTLDNLSNRVKNFFNPPEANIIFMHIPKTGGTSVDISLRQAYGNNKSYKIDSILTSQAAKKVNHKELISIDKFQIRESLLLYEMAKKTNYISGHFRFNEEIYQAYREQYYWITVLRNPVKRYISQYFFDAYKPKDHARVNASLENFIESERGQFRGQNYINYFGNFSRRDRTDFDTRLKVATENLSKFSLIAFLDDLDKFRNDLKSQFNLIVKIPHMNKNPVPKPKIEESIIKKIEKICEYDLKLYHYAEENF